jgi:integrase
MERQPEESGTFKQRRGGRGKLRVWVWSEDERITLRERLNSSNGVGYRVTFPKGITGSKVVFVQSRNFDDAVEIARSRAAEFRDTRSSALVLRNSDKVQAAAAIKVLRAAGIRVPLDQVAREYADASTVLSALGVSVARAATLYAEALAITKPAGKTVAEAVEYAAKRLTPAGGSLTLAAVAQELTDLKEGWLARGDLRPASYHDFKIRAKKIATEIGSYPLAELTKGTVLQWLKGISSSPRTAKNYRMVLGEILRYATQKRQLVDNPIAELTRADIKDLEGRGGENKQPAILSPANAAKLLQGAFADAKADLGAAIVLGLFAGVRTEEILRLKWDAVHLDDPQPFIVIGAEIAKKRRIRNVPLSAVAVAWLRQWKHSAGPITRNEHKGDFQSRMRKLCARIGVERESNAMRHSFGSYHFALHGDSMETARILGHKADDNVLFAHYRALTTKQQAEAYFGLVPQSEGSQVVCFPGCRVT